MTPKSFALTRNKTSVALLVLALVIGGISAQATGLLNLTSGGYLVCVNPKTSVVTHPSTSKCPKGFKKLILGAKGDAGTVGLTGAAGLPGVDGKNGSDGKNGLDGKTLWNGTTDPASTWGAPGDMFVNSATKVLFGPKELTTGWPAGVPMLGLQGVKGDTGERGLTGPQGLTGASGSAGAAGSAGANGSNGAAGAAGSDGSSAPTVTGTDCIGAKCTYKVGDTGPGGGIIFFVDYNDIYTSIKYLEAAPVGWGSSITVNQGGLTGETTGSATVDPVMKWCSDTSTLLSLDLWTHSGVGKGATNTSTADTTCAGGAIQAAADYAGGSKIDWFLPSVGEVMLMYTNMRQIGVGGFVSYSYYWSSSENSATYAWIQYFLGGYQDLSFKSGARYVRPVRAF